MTAVTHHRTTVDVVDTFYRAAGPVDAPVLYDFLKESWNNPGPESRRRIAQHVTLHGFETEFRGELPNEVADRISPDLWTLHWSLMCPPERIANLIRLLEDQPTTLGGKNGATQGNRTPDLFITSELLYRLS